MDPSPFVFVYNGKSASSISDFESFGDNSWHIVIENAPCETRNNRSLLRMCFYLTQPIPDSNLGVGLYANFESLGINEWALVGKVNNTSPSTVYCIRVENVLLNRGNTSNNNGKLI